MGIRVWMKRLRFEPLLKQDALGESHLFVSRSDTSFPSGIQHRYFTTEPAQKLSAIERNCRPKRGPLPGEVRSLLPPAADGAPLLPAPEADAFPVCRSKCNSKTYFCK